MKLHNRVALTILAGALITGSLCFFAAWVALSREFIALEHQTLVAALPVLEEVLEARGEALLAAISELPGEMPGKSDADVEAPAGADFFAETRIAFLLYMDPSSDALAGWTSDGETVRPMARMRARELGELAGEAARKGVAGPAVRQDSDLLAAIAARGNVDILAGAPLTEVLREATAATDVRADLIAADAPGHAGLEAVLERLDEGLGVHVEARHGFRAEVYTLLETPFATAPMVLRASRLGGQGRFTLTVLAVGLVVMALALTFAAHCDVRRGITVRIQHLRESLATIRETGDTSGRVVTHGSDEVAMVGRDFNAALEAIQDRDAEVRANEKRLRNVLEYAAEGIITIDSEGRVLSMNRAAEGIFGYKNEEVAGKNVSMLMPEPYRSHHDEYLQNYATTGQARLIGKGREVLGQRKGGKSFPMHLSVSEARGGDTPIYAAIVRDITQHKVEQRTLKQAATYDVLTGLMNRGVFEKELEAAMASAKHNGHALCLCMCDIDKFKAVNDLYGHQAGDDVLRKMGELIREEVRRDDLAGRFGGDEFCICFTHAPAIEGIAATERIRERLGSHVFGRERGQPLFFVKATFGLADLVSHEMDLKALFKAADQALYRAKERGRNRSHIADE